MAPSALINTPPENDRDLLIASGMLLYAGITPDIRNPSEGVKMMPTRPDDYAFETKGPGILAGLSITIAAIFFATATRLFLRLYMPRLKWGLDDTLMVPGLLLALAYPTIQIAMVQYAGAGKHIFDVTYAEYYNYKWLANIAQIDFFVCVGVIKMSITAFNIRLTSLASPRWKLVNWIFFVLCALYTLCAFLINILQCDPPGANFDLFILARNGRPPRCIGVSNMNTILRVINIVLDYCLLACPLILLWRVRMSRRKKIRIFALFGVGGLACIASVMTLIAKFNMDLRNTDPLWNYTGVLGWSLGELTIGVVAASLPTLAFLLPKPLRPTQAPYSNCAQVHVVHSSNHDKYMPKRRSNTVTVSAVRRDTDPSLLDAFAGRDPRAIYCTEEIEMHRKSASVVSEMHTPLKADMGESGVTEPPGAAVRLMRSFSRRRGDTGSG